MLSVRCRLRANGVEELVIWWQSIARKTTASNFFFLRNAQRQMFVTVGTHTTIGCDYCDKKLEYALPICFFQGTQTRARTRDKGTPNARPTCPMCPPSRLLLPYLRRLKQNKKTSPNRRWTHFPHSRMMRWLPIYWWCVLFLLVAVAFC